MDFATIAGLIAVTAVMVFGIKPENLNAFIDFPSVIIVMGGTAASAMVGYPLAQLTNLVAVVKNAFFVKSQSPVKVIGQIIDFAEQARREGILALENRALEITDEFLKSGIQLAVDGTEPDLIKDIMTTEILYTENRHKDGVKILEFMGAMAPAFGMLGTVIGLILMLGNMSDVDALGPAMATALITTLYGALVANGACLPIAAKLKTYSAKEIMIKELMLEGIMSLQSGDNPRIVEQKLMVFLEPMLRAAVSKDKKR